MYGIQCNMCRRFATLEDAEGWGRIQTLTTSYDDRLEPTGPALHVCPACLSMIREGFID